jgi:DNA repair protein RadC
MSPKRNLTGINTWPKDDRPRERLLMQGAQALTDAELLAILLRVGLQGTNAVELGRHILKKFGSLKALSEAPLSALLAVKGLKSAKAAQLAACAEIARRITLPDNREHVIIKSTQAAEDYLSSRLRGLSEEHCRALLLNRRGLVLEDVMLAFGTVDQAKPPIRLIVTKVLQANASVVILAHNHPSGLVEASESDRLFTTDVFAALKPIGVKLLDHIIIGEEKAFSFADNGIMDEIAFTAGCSIKRKN